MSDGISVSGDEIRIRTKDYVLRWLNRHLRPEVLDAKVATENEFRDLLAWCRTAQNGSMIPEKWLHVWKLRGDEVRAALRRERERERDLDKVSLGVSTEVREQMEREQDYGSLSLDARIAHHKKHEAVTLDAIAELDREERRRRRETVTALQCFATAACPRG